MNCEKKTLTGRGQALLKFVFFSPAIIEICGQKNWCYWRAQNLGIGIKEDELRTMNAKVQPKCSLERSLSNYYCNCIFMELWKQWWCWTLIPYCKHLGEGRQSDRHMHMLRRSIAVLQAAWASFATGHIWPLLSWSANSKLISFRNLDVLAAIHSIP